MSSVAVRGDPGKEIRQRVGALPVAATLLALMISTGIGATASTARAATAPAASGQTGTSPLPAPQPLPGLFPGAGYEPGGSRLVLDLQRRLAQAGYRPGPIDGRYGPLTDRAIWRFQTDRGLQADGIAGRQTMAALEESPSVLLPGAGYQTWGSRQVSQLQRLLSRAGYPAGPVDGRYGPLTQRAVRRFQADRGLPVNGIAGPRTYADLRSRPGPPNATRGPAPRPAKVPRAQPKPQPHAIPSAPLPIGWVVLLGGLALGLLLTVLGYGLRRRGGQVAARIEVPDDEDQPATAEGSPNGARPIQSDGAESTTTEHRATNGAPRDRRGHDQSVTAISSSNGSGHRLDGTSEADDAFNRGVLLEEQHDLAGAEAAYRHADERGHAAAASNLGVLLEGQGDPAGAEAAYQRADGRGEPNGAFNLGVLLEEQHDFAGAEAAYRRADERGHAAAASNLGVLLEGQGDLAGAEAAYRRAADRGEANGAFNLGVLLEEQGDLAGAAPAYQRAGQTGQPKVAQLARSALLDLRDAVEYAGPGRNGDHDGA